MYVELFCSNRAQSESRVEGTKSTLLCRTLVYSCGEGQEFL